MQTRRTGVAGAAVVCVAMASAFGCSLLLDTDKLKEGTGQTAGSGGTGGQLPDGSMPDADASQDTSQETPPGDVTQEPSTTPCKEDTDCYFAPGAGDLCKKYKCDTIKSICAEPTANTDPVVREVDTVPFAVTFDKAEIGVPTLLVDGESVYLAAWFDDGTDKNILLRRYDPNGTEKTSTYSDLFGLWCKDVISSPGLLLEVAGTPLQKRVAFLVANSPDIATKVPCVRRFWMGLDMDTGNVDVNCLAFPSEAYDAAATRTAPQLLKRTTDDVAMWVQHGELCVANQKVTTLGGVQSFSMLHGVNPLVGAIFEAGSSSAEEQTYIWYTNEGALSGLNSIAKGPRLGTSTIFLGEALGTAASLVLWSHPAPGQATTIESFEEDCHANNCEAKLFTAPGQPPSGVNHLAPTMSIRRKLSPPSADVMTGAVTTSVSGADTELALYAQFIRLEPQPLQLNPPVAMLSSKVAKGTPDAEAVAKLMGQTASVITDGGRIFVTWVERDDKGKATLYLRRYQVEEDCHKE